jgi:hypothetical protein
MSSFQIFTAAAPEPRYHGGTVPSNSKLFRTIYPAGLCCSCNSRNSTFHTLTRWKKHCKGKKHIEWTKTELNTLAMLNKLLGSEFSADHIRPLVNDFSALQELAAAQAV